MAVKIGDEFRSSLADGNPLWRVTAKAGRGVWLASVVDEPYHLSDGRVIPSDFAGTERAFKSSEIERAKGWEQMFARLGNEHDAYYASLEPGQVVHYHNGFGQYVRCAVVLNAKDERELLPIAMVGNWRAYDLPTRRSDGSIHLPYYPDKIAKGDTFTPNAGNIYEAPGYSDRNGVDPRTLEPIDLSVPDLTAEQAEAARWEQLRRTLAGILETHEGKDAVETVVAALEVEGVI